MPFGDAGDMTPDGGALGDVVTRPAMRLSERIAVLSTMLAGRRAIFLAAALYLVWIVWIFRELSAVPKGAALLVVYAALIGGLLIAVRPLATRAALLIYSLGLLWYTAQILVVQAFPQWRDLIPDSVTYRLNAEALVLHWRQLPVPGRAFNVFPYPDISFTEWLPGVRWGYAFVFGSHHFLYQLYAGVIYFLVGSHPQTVILSHVILLASMAVFTAGLARLLFDSRKAAVVAAVLVLLDSNFAVNAAWMIKDTMVTWLALLAALLSVRLLRKRDLTLADTAILSMALTLLSCARFHAVVIALLALAAGTVTYWRSAPRVAVRVGSVIAVTLALSGVAKVHELSPINVAKAAVFGNWSSIKGPADVLGASWSSATPSPSGPSVAGAVSASPEPLAGDDSVIRFYRQLSTRPVVALTKAVAHTLFAPYPWVPFTHGFLGTFAELHYPGTALWILGLPYLALGLAALGARRPERLYVVVVLGLTTVLYIAVYGEFSTRQRQFVAPVCWAVAAYGWVVFMEWWRVVRNAGEKAAG